MPPGGASRHQWANGCHTANPVESAGSAGIDARLRQRQEVSPHLLPYRAGLVVRLSPTRTIFLGYFLLHFFSHLGTFTPLPPLPPLALAVCVVLAAGKTRQILYKPWFRYMCPVQLTSRIQSPPAARQCRLAEEGNKRTVLPELPMPD